MGGQTDNHNQYTQAIEPNTGHTATYPGGGITWKKKEEIIKLNWPIKIGVDKKATHLWKDRE